MLSHHVCSRVTRDLQRDCLLPANQGWKHEQIELCLHSGNSFLNLFSAILGGNFTWSAGFKEVVGTRASTSRCVESYVLLPLPYVSVHWPQQLSKSWLMVDNDRTHCIKVKQRDYNKHQTALKSCTNIQLTVCHCYFYL